MCTSGDENRWGWAWDLVNVDGYHVLALDRVAADVTKWAWRVPRRMRMACKMSEMMAGEAILQHVCFVDLLQDGGH